MDHIVESKEQHCWRYFSAGRHRSSPNGAGVSSEPESESQSPTLSNSATKISPVFVIDPIEKRLIMKTTM